ncbi:MAG: hypothetical protein ACLP9L_15720 [Thermoguttaceae bacterium]
MQLQPASGEPIGSQLLSTNAGFSPVALGDSLGFAMKPEGCGAVVSTTGSASQVLDWSTFTIMNVAMPASAITWAPTFVNVTIGQSVQIVTTQGGSSASTASWPSGVKMSGGTKGMTASTGAVDMFTLTCVAAGVFYGFASQAMA